MKPWSAVGLSYALLFLLSASASVAQPTGVTPKGYPDPNVQLVSRTTYAAPKDAYNGPSDRCMWRHHRCCKCRRHHHHHHR
jgi:hypothetical protein